MCTAITSLVEWIFVAYVVHKYVHVRRTLKVVVKSPRYSYVYVHVY